MNSTDPTKWQDIEVWYDRDRAMVGIDLGEGMRKLLSPTEARLFASGLEEEIEARGMSLDKGSTREMLADVRAIADLIEQEHE